MTTPAGWYPDPAGAGLQRYYDGTQWTDRYAPLAAPPPPAAAKPAPNPAVNIGVIILGIVGVVMTMQTVSLMSGSGVIWIGVGVAAAGAAAAFMLNAVVGVRVIACALLVFAVGNALYIEKQMSDRREEIGRVFDTNRYP